MSTTASHGFTLGYDQETTLGDGGSSFGEIRPEEVLDWPTNTKQLVDNPNVGHAHPADRSDDPEAINATGEGSLNVRIRRSTSANTAPPIADYFESAGCNIKTTTATTVTTYVDEGQWTLGDAGDAYGKCGDIIMPKLEEASDPLDEYYYPCIVAKKATNVVNPGMELPAATTDSEPIEVMTTIRPLSQPTASAKTLGFVRHTRADITNDGSNDFRINYKASALGSVGEITLTYGNPIILPLNFLFGNITKTTEEMAAETFVDSERFAIVTDAFRVGLAASATIGNISRTSADFTMREIKIDLGFNTAPIEGYGSGTVSGRSNYACDLGTPKVTLTGVYTGEAAHPQWWTQLETPGTWNYLELVQPTSSLAVPAWAFFMPACRLDSENPPQLDFSQNVCECVVTLIGSSAKYVPESGADGLWDDPGYSAWYMGISGASA